MGKKSPDQGSGIRKKHPGSYFKSLVTILWAKTAYTFYVAVTDPGSGAFLTLNPGWKNSAPGSVINISDPQHCFGKLRYGNKNSKIHFFLFSASIQ
jgi:hypothetical protein